MSETCINREELFDEENNFIPMKAVKQITNLTNAYPLLTPVDRGIPGAIWLYHAIDGIWRPDGETWIQDVMQRLLGEDASTRRIKEVVELTRIATYTPAEIFKEDPGSVTLLNGTFDLHTMTLEPHDPLKYSKNRLPVKYDPGADCPAIKKFIAEVCPDPTYIKTVQEWIGYHLVKHYHYQKCFLAVGSGNNGKSTLLNLLYAFLGGSENVSDESLYQLVTGRFSTAQLYCKLANIAPDLGSTELKHTSTFKALTGGDPINAEHKFQQKFNFINYAKLSFSCNQLPTSPDESDAFYRRFLIIEFNEVFDETNCDKHILDKLTTEQELSGLFNYALEGLMRLQQNEGFTLNPSTLEIKEKYAEMSDPITAFVNQCLSADLDGYIEKDTLYRTYYNWCKDRGRVPVATNKFSMELKGRCYVEDGQRRVGDKRPKVWEGITLCEACVPQVQPQRHYPQPPNTLNEYVEAHQT